MKRRVVVTGLGAVTALGTKVNELWQALLRGQSGIRQITIIDPEVEKKLKVHFAGELSDWNPEEYISTKERNRIDRFAQFGLVAAIDAVRQSGLDFKAENPWRCGVIIGSGIGGLTEIEQQIERLIVKGPDRVSAFTIPKMMANAASGHVSIHYGIKGINTAVATACASAANAIGDAFRAIQHGVADIMITGGAEPRSHRLLSLVSAHAGTLGT